MTIRVLSFDFDGCIFNSKLLSSTNKDPIGHNRNFLDSIKTEKAQHSNSIAFIGSNRQSKNIDDGNSLNSGSCFPAIQLIAKYLEIDFDTFLLADIYGELEHGESYKRAMSPTNLAHEDWRFDETKATILYAQMHKVAAENPNEDIIFDFYDDRYEDILLWLNVFYSEHPEMVPKNVTLRLNYYEGDIPSQLFEIKGQGIIDTNYPFTVKDMAQQAMKIEGTDGIRQEIHTAHHVRPEYLLNRKELEANTAHKPTSRVKHAHIKIAEPVVNAKQIDNTQYKAKMDAFDAQLDIIKTKKIYFTTGEGANPDAKKAAENLCNNLHYFKISFLKNEITYDAFSNKCKSAIKEAHKELDKHRGWKDVLFNLLLAITVIGHVIKGVVNLAISRPFFAFTKTDSAKILDAVEESVEQIVTAPAA